MTGEQIIIYTFRDILFSVHRDITKFYAERKKKKICFSFSILAQVFSVAKFARKHDIRNLQSKIEIHFEFEKNENEVKSVFFFSLFLSCRATRE